MIAALYVIKNGPYYGLENVDPWDEDRDARKYNGPWPVIAHPPCQLWGNLAFVNYKRWGGKHNKPGNDSGCFESALLAVNTFGGVIEHPKNSRAFKVYNLEIPKKRGWIASGRGFTCEVWQSAYGHRANKATWLYYYSPDGVNPPELKWDRVVGTHQVGGCDHRGKNRNKPTLSKKEANETPIQFRDLLISIASGARRECGLDKKEE